MPKLPTCLGSAVEMPNSYWITQLASTIKGSNSMTWEKGDCSPVSSKIQRTEPKPENSVFATILSSLENYPTAANG